MRKVFNTSRIEWKIPVLTILSTLLLMVDHYHYPLLPWSDWFPNWDANISPKVLDRTFLYFVIPMLCVLVLFRENPKNFGFTLGDWKKGLIITCGGILLMTPLLLIIGIKNPSISGYYEAQYAGLPWNTFLDLFGWEFMFRGFLLFGYTRKLGVDGIWFQAVPFALAHIGKPELETLTTIFGGFAFGWIAWKTKSFLYPFLIHWYIASGIIFVAARLAG